MSESKDDLQNVWDFISELNDSDLISKLNGHDFKIVEQNLTEEQINKIKKKKYRVMKDGLQSYIG